MQVRQIVSPNDPFDRASSTRPTPTAIGAALGLLAANDSIRV